MKDAEPVYYVGFWARVVATLVDTFVLGLLAAPVVWMLGLGDGPAAQLDLIGDFRTLQVPETFAPVLGAQGGVQLLLFAVLVLVFWKWKSATPGKMVIGAQIVDAETLGPPSGGQLLGRYLGYFVSTLVMGLGFIWVAFDRRKQGWHDKLAGTVVIRKL